MRKNNFKTIAFRIPEETVKKLDKEAKILGLTRSALLRTIINKHIFSPTISKTLEELKTTLNEIYSMLSNVSIMETSIKVKSIRPRKTPTANYIPEPLSDPELRREFLSELKNKILEMRKTIEIET